MNKAAQKRDERESLLTQAKWDALYRRVRFKEGHWQVADRPALIPVRNKRGRIVDYTTAELEWRPAPWHRVARKRWFDSYDYLLYDALQFGLKELEARQKEAQNDLDWCRDKVCEGCTDEYVIQHGTVRHFTGRPLHDFHISLVQWICKRITQIRWRHVHESYLQRKQWLERIMLKKTEFPKELFYSFGERVQSETIGTLVMAEAGHFPNNNGGQLTLAVVNDRLKVTRNRLELDRKRLEVGDLPEYGGMTEEEQLATLQRWITQNEQRIAFMEWFKTRYKDKLEVK